MHAVCAHLQHTSISTLYPRILLIPAPSLLRKEGLLPQHIATPHHIRHTLIAVGVLVLRILDKYSTIKYEKDTVNLFPSLKQTITLIQFDYLKALGHEFEGVPGNTVEDAMV